MESFVYSAAVALLCHSFLLLTFAGAERNRGITAYLLALDGMLLWTSGTLFMRTGAFLMPVLGCALTFLGLCALSFAYLLLGRALGGGGGRGLLLLWGSLFTAAWLLNLYFGYFLEAVRSGGLREGNSFVAAFGPGAPVLILLLFGAPAQMVFRLLRRARADRAFRRTLLPFAAGLLLLALCQLPLLLPSVQVGGNSLGPAGGVLNALCMLYGLYRHRFFRPSIFVSRRSCSALAGVLSILFFGRFALPIHRVLEELFLLESEQSLLVLSLLVVLATLGLYRLLAFSLDQLFVREELLRAAWLREFSENIARSLKPEEIFENIAEVIRATVRPARLSILLRDAQSGDFLPAPGLASAEGDAPSLPGEHSLAGWMEERKSCLLLSEARHAGLTRTLNAQERALLASLDAECVVGLREGEWLSGLILLSAKRSRNGSYRPGDISLLDSIASISSVAVANARLYAAACLEARTDELTGLYSRKYFYECFQEEVEKEQPLALCLFSVDELKLYNQLYSYREGDQAIVAIGRIIEEAVGEDGIVARHSGKVFAVLLPRYTLRRAKELAERVRLQVCRMNSAREDCALRALTVSAGIAAMPSSATSAKELFGHADLALFHVKHNGKNAVLAYTTGDYELQKAKISVAEQRTAYNEHESTIFALMAAIDAKDHYTFSHSMNVLYYATKLARRLNMSAEYIEILREAALLHDIGKIGIPENVLNKLGALNLEEYNLMKGHVEQSIAMIKFLPSLDYVIPSVIGHHERYDGRGYPRGLKGEEIPLGARILCIADSFDAMMSKRSYKEPYPLERTISILEEEAGRQFDPRLVRLFIHLLREGEIELRGVSVTEEAV